MSSEKSNPGIQSSSSQPPPPVSSSSSSSSSLRHDGNNGTSGKARHRSSPPTAGRIGVCALDVKARSKPSQSILTRLQSKGGFEVIVFGDKVILDEAVENWPICDFLIAFFSDGFPLDKAIAYAELRKPYCVNDLPMQKVLWDRRLCLKILDHMGVPSPKRIEVNRDGGPTLESPELAQHVYLMTGVRLDGPPDGTGGGAPRTRSVSMSEDGESLIVDGKAFKKPFVEKPVNGEDHNIHIYFPNDEQYGGGGRRLFRKIGNKSSEYDPDLVTPRSLTEKDTSYLYEQFLRVDNAEDVKAYTVGPNYCHAETRKSPVIDGLVRRNTHGKELRYITKLSKEEAAIAAKISNGFGQRICGFDMLRVGDRSYVIDVNGWSFVKDNNAYYDKSADILKDMFLSEKRKLQEHLNSRDSFSTTGSADTQDASYGMKALQAKNRDASAVTESVLPESVDARGRSNTADGPQSPRALFAPASNSPAGSLHHHLPGEKAPPPPASKHSWKLKGMVAVIRHADRTPKQKFKFTFHSQPFVDLLKGHQEEVLLKGEPALASVSEAVSVAMNQRLEDMDKLKLLRLSLEKKGGWPGTKVQIKPMFRKRRPEEMRGHSNNSSDKESDPASATRTVPKSRQQSAAAPSAHVAGEDSLHVTQTRSNSISGSTFSRFSAAENDLILDKLQLVMKWGGEPTHAARYQSQDLGVNMRDDLKLMNKEALEHSRIFTSSERRVSTSGRPTFLSAATLP